jgi:hypothetical protein
MHVNGWLQIASVSPVILWYQFGMTKLFERAAAEVAKLPEPEQDRIGQELIAHLEKLRRLRSDIDEGLRSLNAGEGRELDIEAVIARGRLRNAEP